MGPMTPSHLVRPILMTIPSKTKKSFYEQKVQYLSENMKDFVSTNPFLTK